VVVRQSAREFYQRRDERTNRLTSSRSYHQLGVRLVASPGTTRSYGGQAQLLITANMLARWCRNLEFGFPDAPLMEQLRISGYTSLHQRIRAEVTHADPFGQFAFGLARTDKVRYALKVGGGCAAEPIDFTIDTDGWTVHAGRGDCNFGITTCQDTPIGPAFAACVGVADAFKVATGLPPNKRVQNVSISVFDNELTDAGVVKDHPRISDSLKLGKVQIVGVGSVGSAVVYLLAMLRLNGFVYLIDHDDVEEVNLNRSPLFGFSDIGKRKVQVAEQYLRPRIRAQAFQGRYDHFIESFDRRPGDTDVILPLANEFGVRSFVENNLPPLQIYGTTTTDWGINFHRHIPFQDDCSLCRFPSEVHQANFVCSEAQIGDEEGEQVDAALPFLSMGAAALTVADLIKLQMPGYPFTPNFAFIDFKGNLEFLITYRRKSKATCLCPKRSSAIHKHYNGSTRFSALSQ
jgi:molybdopterin/thiamine biosynthesis adenylyltransferase